MKKQMINSIALPATMKYVVLKQSGEPAVLDSLPQASSLMSMPKHGAIYEIIKDITKTESRRYSVVP